MSKPHAPKSRTPSPKGRQAPPPSDERLDSELTPEEESALADEDEAPPAKEQLANAQALVTDTLVGVANPEKNAHLFDDDVLLFALAKVEELDPEWLIRLLADERIPKAGRALLARATQSKALAETRARFAASR